MADQSRDIPIEDIVPPRTLLRLVAKETVEFLEMRDSLREHGFWNSISVRPATNEGKYEIIDGLYRFTCAKEIGLSVVPCIVKQGVSDDDILSAQIQANSIRPETTPVEFARQMRRILIRRPEMTFAELAQRVKKSPTWVKKQLGLLRLKKNIQPLVDRGEIGVSTAYMLAKIPPHLQSNYVDQARSMSNQEFCSLAASVIKKFVEAVKQGRMEAFLEGQFEATAYLRSLKEVRSESESKQVGAMIVAAEDCHTPLDGFYAALHWALHLDKASREKQQKAGLNLQQ